MARISKDKARVQELEALLEKKGINAPAQLEGEYKHDDGNVYAFRKGKSGHIIFAGDEIHKNDAIKDKELMTQLVENGTKLIEIVGTHEDADDVETATEEA